MFYVGIALGALSWPLVGWGLWSLKQAVDMNDIIVFDLVVRPFSTLERIFFETESANAEPLFSTHLAFGPMLVAATVFGWLFVMMAAIACTVITTGIGLVNQVCRFLDG